MRLHYNKIKDSVLDVKLDKRNECFNWGKDNAYPSLVTILIQNSVTAKSCVDKVSKAIYGKSFGDVGKIVVNSQGESLNEVFRIASREYAKQNNVFLHIGYVYQGSKLYYKSIVVVPSTSVRIGKADDKGYSGKFIVYDNWDKSKGTRIMSEGFQLYDKFTTNEKATLGQIEEAEGIQNYNGQILHIRKDKSYKYSLPDIYSVMGEALLESNSQTFRTKGTTKGFLNTKLLVTPPMGEKEGKKFNKELNGVRGADNSSEVVHLEAMQAGDEMSKAIYLADLSGEYNDKLFEYSDKMAEKNICKAYEVPQILVAQNENSIFGNSGELLNQAKLQLWESREEDRDQLEEVFNNIMEGFKKPIEKIKVINPYENLTNSKTEFDG